MFIFVFILAEALLYNVTTIPATMTPPPARLYLTSSYSHSLNSLIVFGGSISAESYYNDLWLFSLDVFEWAHISPISTSNPCKP